jgi:SWI/SNF-related matrix-associated actin-dependent regulator of chromatin subfamily A3
VTEEENGGGGGEETEAEHRNRLVSQLRKMIQDGVTEDCSICLDDLKSPVITPCAHVYCRPCIERVLDTVRPPICPLCRGGLGKRSLLEAGNLNEDEEQKENEDETLKALESIEVDVSSNKVNAVIKEMIRIREADASDKIIVVSQFTTFLSVIQPVLAENAFSFVRLDGTMSHIDRAEVVRLFQKKTENSPKVLLLSLKAGGVGLNLTAANHLLLLDPAWNPAAEWQCFDRAHRIGQTKPVTIYKFITKESIEEKMMAIQAKKEELISGAFHMPDDERRRQRINDVLNIFNIGARPAPAPGIPAPTLPALLPPAPV